MDWDTPEALLILYDLPLLCCSLNNKTQLKLNSSVDSSALLWPNGVIAAPKLSYGKTPQWGCHVLMYIIVKDLLPIHVGCIFTDTSPCTLKSIRREQNIFIHIKTEENQNHWLQQPFTLRTTNTDIQTFIFCVQVVSRSCPPPPSVGPSPVSSLSGSGLTLLHLCWWFKLYCCQLVPSRPCCSRYWSRETGGGWFNWFQCGGHWFGCSEASLPGSSPQWWGDDTTVIL